MARSSLAEDGIVWRPHDSFNTYYTPSILIQRAELAAMGRGITVSRNTTHIAHIALNVQIKAHSGNWAWHLPFANQLKLPDKR